MKAPLSLYKMLRWYKQVIDFQKQTPLTMPLSRRFKTLRHGFRSSSYALYDFSTNDPRAYLPDTVHAGVTINGVLCSDILHDKLLFERFFKDIVKTPAVLGVVDRGTLHPVQEFAFSSARELLAYCEGSGGVMLKPRSGRQGRGVQSVYLQDGLVFISGKPATLEELEKLLGSLDAYLVTERIVQDGYAHHIFPASVNSIRIMTMQDPAQDHRSFIPVAVHRFGSRSTGPTDNVSRGGLMAKIALDTGVMSRAVKFPRETHGELRWCSHHPDTGMPIEGVTVPDWSELTLHILAITERFKFLRYVGWDIVIAEGEFWVIAGNYTP